MPYAVAWTPAADEDFERLASAEPLAASAILDAIDHLADNPAALAHAPSPPYRENEWWYTLPPLSEFPNNRYTILFEWSKDGDGIAITGIGAVRF